jgi:predicted RNA binding protein YcfA (HicA-like mRNA interferase family)
MRYEDVYALLTGLGWTLKRDSGTHVSFVKPGELPLGIVKESGKRVKRTYLTLICDRLGLND